MDKRTEVVKRQQQLWQLLGTLERAKTNIKYLSDPSCGIKLPESDLSIMRKAVYVIEAMSLCAKLSIKNLPNKKRVAAAILAEVKLSKEIDNG